MICTFSFIVVLSVQRNFHKLLQPFKNGKYQQFLIYEGDVSPVQQSAKTVQQHHHQEENINYIHQQRL